MNKNLFKIDIATIERSPEGKIEMMRVTNGVTGEQETLYCDPKPIRFCSGHELEIAKQLKEAKQSSELNGISFNPRISITSLNGRVP